MYHKLIFDLLKSEFPKFFSEDIRLKNLVTNHISTVHNHPPHSSVPRPQKASQPSDNIFYQQSTSIWLK